MKKTKKTKKMFVKLMIILSGAVIIGCVIFKCVSEWK